MWLVKNQPFRSFCTILRAKVHWFFVYSSAQVQRRSSLVLICCNVTLCLVQCSLLSLYSESWLCNASLRLACQAYWQLFLAFFVALDVEASMKHVRADYVLKLWLLRSTEPSFMWHIFHLVALREYCALPWSFVTLCSWFLDPYHACLDFIPPMNVFDLEIHLSKKHLTHFSVLFLLLGNTI